MFRSRVVDWMTEPLFCDHGFVKHYNPAYWREKRRTAYGHGTASFVPPAQPWCAEGFHFDALPPAEILLAGPVSTPARPPRQLYSTHARPHRQPATPASAAASMVTWHGWSVIVLHLAIVVRAR